MSAKDEDGKHYHCEKLNSWLTKMEHENGATLQLALLFMLKIFYLLRAFLSSCSFHLCLPFFSYLNPELGDPRISTFLYALHSYGALLQACYVARVTLKMTFGTVLKSNQWSVKTLLKCGLCTWIMALLKWSMRTGEVPHNCFWFFVF